MNLPNIKYDPDVKVLSLKLSKNEITDSDVNENFVIDYDKNRNIVQIDVFNVNLEEVVKK